MVRQENLEGRDQIIKEYAQCMVEFPGEFADEVFEKMTES